MLKHYLKINKNIIIGLVVMILCGILFNFISDYINVLLDKDAVNEMFLTDAKSTLLINLLSGISMFQILLSGFILGMTILATYYPFTKKRRKVLFTLYGQRKLILFQILANIALIVVVSFAIAQIIKLDFIVSMLLLFIIFCFNQAVYYAIVLINYTNIKYLSKGEKFKKLLPWIGYCLTLLIIGLISNFLIFNLSQMLDNTSYSLFNMSLSELTSASIYASRDTTPFIFSIFPIYGLVNYGIIISSKNKVGI